MYRLSTLLVVATAFFCYVQAQNCKSGICMKVASCPALMEVLVKPNKTPEELQRLRESSCGFEGKQPKVCCPIPECYTPEGHHGKCMDLYQCPHMKQMLLDPTTNNHINFVKNSLCKKQGVQYPVCCGPAFEKSADLSDYCPATLSATPPDPSSGCCGIDGASDNKIFGGKETKVDQYPWLALIEYTKPGEPLALLCGGALISSTYVLTAAHCVLGGVLDFGNPDSVRLGEHDITNDGIDCVNVEAMGRDCNAAALSFPVAEVIPHPLYKVNAKPYDIALLRLAKPVPYTDFMRPICLPTKDWTLTPPANFTFKAAGWGATSEEQAASPVKLDVDLPFVSQEVCQPQYNMPMRKAKLLSSQLCAGGSAGKDTCKGDSGGPLMYENVDPGSRYYELTGVISFGPLECGTEGVPGVYSKVFEFKSWILQNIKK